ncbi:hypothetical protein Tco_1500963, partial [Tanacetum coccineum]
GSRLKMNLPDHRIKQKWRWRHLVPVESIHHPMLTLNASKCEQWMRRGQEAIDSGGNLRLLFYAFVDDALSIADEPDVIPTSRINFLFMIIVLVSKIERSSETNAQKTPPCIFLSVVKADETAVVPTSRINFLFMIIVLVSKILHRRVNNDTGKCSSNYHYNYADRNELSKTCRVLWYMINYVLPKEEITLGLRALLARKLKKDSRLLSIVYWFILGAATIALSQTFAAALSCVGTHCKMQQT